MRTITFLTLVCLLLTSCIKDRIEGNGNIISETRILKNFSAVSSSGSKHIHISYGSDYKVELRGSSNLISRYKTSISGRTLNLGYENLVSIIDDDVEVYVTAPKIEELNLSGSGKLNIPGTFPMQDRFTVFISGSGDVNVNDSFKVNSVRVELSGSGEANLENMECNNADIDVSGSGKVKLGVEELLKVNISGSGRVYYWGDARVDSRISGSGRVIRQ